MHLELVAEYDVFSILINYHRGGVVVWRTAQWQPDLVSAAFSVCTPFFKQQEQFFTLEMLVRGPLPQFGYQLQFAGQELERKIESKHDVSKLLNGVYGGRGPNGEIALDPAKGIIFENLEKLRPTKLLKEEVMRITGSSYKVNGAKKTSRKLTSTATYLRKRDCMDLVCTFYCIFYRRKESQTG